MAKTKQTNKDVLDYSNLYSQVLSNINPNAGQYTYTPTETLNLNGMQPQLMDANKLAQLMGLDYNYEDIYNTLTASTKAGYDARYAQQAATESKYYDRAATAQSTLAETLQQQQSQALQTGTSRGMQAANALSSVLGVSQQFADDAGQLAQGRAQIAKDEAAAYAQAGEQALGQTIDIKKNVSDLAKNIYSSDTSAYVGALDYNASANAANAQLGAQQMAANASYDTAYANNVADIMNAYYSGQITLEQAQIAADASIEASKVYGTDAAAINKQASDFAANLSKAATEYNADKNLEGTQYAARKNLEGTMAATMLGYQGTKYAADKSKEGYVESANASNKAQTTGLLSSILSGVAAGTMKASDALPSLTAMYYQGDISSDTYKSILDTLGYNSDGTLKKTITEPDKGSSAQDIANSVILNKLPISVQNTLLNKVLPPRMNNALDTITADPKQTLLNILTPSLFPPTVRTK